MNVETRRSFASMLEEMIVEAEDTAGPTIKPLAFDYLSVVEELHSGAIRVSEDAAVAEYADAGGFEPGLAAVVADQPAAAEHPSTEPSSTDPAEIAAELCLDSTPTEELGPLRRRFAFHNHPDRVQPHLRERAIQRMQVANMLIDEAACRKKI